MELLLTILLNGTALVSKKIKLARCNALQALTRKTKYFYLSKGVLTMTKSYIYLIDFITEYWSGDIIINPKEEQHNIDFLEEKTEKKIEILLAEFTRGKTKTEIRWFFLDNCIKDRKFILHWFLIYLVEENGTI